MLAGDVMTPGVTWISPNATVRQAAHLMMSKHVSGLPVIDAAGKLVGILTEGDLLRREELGTARQRPRWLQFLTSPGQLSEEFTHSHGRRVAEVMTRHVHTIDEKTSLRDIVALMNKHGVRRLPVVRKDEVVGVVARADILRALGAALDGGAVELKSQPADLDLRRAIIADLQSQPWAPTGAINVTVRDGLVEFWGTILDDRARDALRVAAENVPGVKGVKDHLVLIEPYTGTIIDAPDDEPPAS